MQHPPDAENKWAALQGGPSSISNHQPDNSTETAAEVQARSLRQRFAVGYCLAASLAPLIYGMGPR